MFPASYYEEFCTYREQRYYEQINGFFDQFITVLRHQLATNEETMAYLSEKEAPSVRPAAATNNYSNFRKCLQLQSLAPPSFVTPELLYVPPAAQLCLKTHRKTPQMLHEQIYSAKAVRVQYENEVRRSQILEGDLAQAQYQHKMLQNRIQRAMGKLERQRVGRQLEELSFELRMTIAIGIRDIGLSFLFEDKRRNCQ